MRETQVPSLGWEDSPAEGNDYPLQSSCLDNSTDGDVWWATVHEITELDMTEQLTHTHTSYLKLHNKLSQMAWFT